jgi:hypothetical protein
MLGNLIRSFQLQNKPYYDPDNPWGGILVAVAFALRSMYHMTLQVMSGQLVFGRDMVLNVQHLKDWTAIKTWKQQIIHKNNQIENSKRTPHHYQVGDLVMLENNRANKYEQPYSRPYHITQVNTSEWNCMSQDQCSHGYSKHATYPSIQDSQFQLWGQVQYAPS